MRGAEAVFVREVAGNARYRAPPIERHPGRDIHSGQHVNRVRDLQGVFVAFSAHAGHIAQEYRGIAGVFVFFGYIKVAIKTLALEVMIARPFGRDVGRAKRNPANNYRSQYEFFAR